MKGNTLRPVVKEACSYDNKPLREFPVKKNDKYSI